MAVGQYVGDKNPDGTSFGQSGQKISFYGATPVAQRASAVQVAVTTTAATSSTPFGYTSTQADAIVSTLNEVVATLTALGLWKGGA